MAVAPLDLGVVPLAEILQNLGQLLEYQVVLKGITITSRLLGWA